MILDQLRDFRNFLYLVWKHLCLPDPTPVQYDIAAYLQHGPDRKIIEAFRGVGKSWITAAYVVWRLYLDPHVNILVVSASKERSDQFSTFAKRLIAEMPVLAHLRPRPGCRDSNIMFDVGPARASHSPSVKSVGIFGQLTGSRADEIVADDVEVPKNSETQVMRDKLAERVKEFDAIIKPDIGKVTYLGTPQCEQSLYNVLPQRGYEIRVWPAQYPDEKVRLAYGDRLAPMVAEALDLGTAQAGMPVDPKRFDEEDLEKRKLSYGRSGYSLQFMLDTSLSDADRYPLRLRDLIVRSVDIDLAPTRVVWAGDPDLVIDDLPNVGLAGDRFHRPMAISRSPEGYPELAPYTGSVMAIDPSGRGKDETTYAVTKMLNGSLYVPDVMGFRGGYEEDVLVELAQAAKRNKVNSIVIEENWGDGMFTQLFKPVLQRIYPCRIEDGVKHSVQKEKRICDTLEPVMNAHRLIVDPEVIRKDYQSIQEYPGERAHHYSLFHQMTRITRDKGALGQDDRLDALAMAVAFWTDKMAQDAAKRQQEHREALLAQELQKFIQAAGGKGPRNPSWVRV
ncbi:phage terminase large subunit [Pyruvatibacter mobilis]|uniref:Phage terminase large subunit n=1 Tax=Pyruvatibacter mobilis TaxID=1712261 RepID=A0A845Q8V2_9HYPH|nr:phage terminase large subunit [Pyruvatibacter mobilis]NBG94511.1 phage terminase large subunit [Pyruvatibacter mobilis]QJD74031.1 phage terminase large subunit [Pyruvatibacter mobilis]GGD03528.1 hypothetical protein GCM10011587_04070 [Pyruvatibacter mobilis]